MGQIGAYCCKMIFCRDAKVYENYNKEIYNHHNIW